MKSVIKTPCNPAAVGGVLFAGLSLSGLASAGGQVGGTIVFVASETAGPALPVPTLGVMAAVLLAGVLLLMAIHALRHRGHHLASLAVIGTAVGAVMTVASMGVLQAIPVLPVPSEINVPQDKLNVPLDFNCGTGSALAYKFTNTTSGSIEVDTITKPSNCILNNTTCFESGEGPATVLAPTESCLVVGVIPVQRG